LTGEILATKEEGITRNNMIMSKVQILINNILCIENSIGAIDK